MRSMLNVIIIKNNWSIIFSFNAYNCAADEMCTDSRASPIHQPVLQGLSLMDGAQDGLGERGWLWRLWRKRWAVIQSSWRRRKPVELYRRVWKSTVCFLNLTQRSWKWSLSSFMIYICQHKAFWREFDNPLLQKYPWRLTGSDIYLSTQMTASKSTHREPCGND